MKNNKKTFLLLIPILIILLIILGIMVYMKMSDSKPKSVHYVEAIKSSSENESYDNIDYDKRILKTYEEYKAFSTTYNQTTELTENDFNSKYYIVVFAENDECAGKINGIRKVTLKNNKINIEIGYNGSCGPCAPVYTIFLVPIEQNKVNDITVVEDYKYTVENKYNCDPAVSYKPIIYLYPEETTNVTVKLLKPENLIVTYPKYNKEWNVLANPNGDLIDNKTNRNLYGLYWEGKNYESIMQDEGFIVKGTNTISFLEQKLKELGLTDREANEFIIYWLPKLEKNKYNYIHFNTEILNNIMPLKVNPKPDTTIRILMEYQPLKNKINIKEQKIKKSERTGFTLVEWGGTEIKRKN